MTDAALHKISSALRPWLQNPFWMFSGALAVFPAVLFALFFLYVCQACASVGHWPSYNNPDPKQIGWMVERDVLALGFMGVPVTASLAVVCAVIGRLCSPRYPFWTVAITAILLFFAFIAYVRADPGGFYDWFWD
jgi:hypothetical protein